MYCTLPDNDIQVSCLIARAYLAFSYKDSARLKFAMGCLDDLSKWPPDFDMKIQFTKIINDYGIRVYTDDGKEL